MLNAEISHLGLQIRMVTKTTHPLFFLRVAFPSISPFCSPDFSIPLTPNITLCSISIQSPLTMINPSLVNTLKELVVKTKKNINTTAYLSQSLRLNDLEESTELEHLFASSHIEYKVNSTWIKMNHSVEDSLSEQINQVISFFLHNCNFLQPESLTPFLDEEFGSFIWCRIGRDKSLNTRFYR